jgi:hypothetical protein
MSATTIIATAFTAIVLPYLLYKVFFAGPKVDLSHFPIINPTAKQSWFSNKHNDRFMAEATKLVKEGQQKVRLVQVELVYEPPTDGSDSMVASLSELPRTKERRL